MTVATGQHTGEPVRQHVWVSLDGRWHDQPGGAAGRAVTVGRTGDAGVLWPPAERASQFLLTRLLPSGRPGTPRD